jgi:2-dehydro-3-deoxyglucarate aldolase
MDNHSLKLKLKNNELSIGSWITIGHPAIAEILSFAKFDWLVIDIEHTVIDYSMVQTLISSIQSKDITALVRVSKNEEVVIKRVLDAGADGIIVPMVNSETDARHAVNYAKYPPVGTRGVGLARAQGYGYRFEEYKAGINDIIIIAQIENYRGIDNLDKILEVEGIDGTLIGPYDLSGSLGAPGDFDNPEMSARLDEYEKISISKNRPMGFHVVDSNAGLVIEKIKSGYSFIAYSTDFLFLGDQARNGTLKIHQFNQIKRTGNK